MQLEFDFGFLECETEKAAPALPYFDAPKCDNERLLNWQHDYRNGNARALDSMYKLGQRIAMRYIETEGIKNRHIARLSYSDKVEKAHNAITYIIARYLRDDWFAILNSFTAYLYLRVRHELFYRRKVDTIVKFVDLTAIRSLET